MGQPSAAPLPPPRPPPPRPPLPPPQYPPLDRRMAPGQRRTVRCAVLPYRMLLAVLGTCYAMRGTETANGDVPDGLFHRAPSSDLWVCPSALATPCPVLAQPLSPVLAQPASYRATPQPWY
eukprot:3723397-Rhodomonas_salina.1